MHVEVGGLDIAFERAGTGQAVALAHGFVGDARSTWGRQIDSLSDEFTVIAWDAPGAGGSTDPPEDFGMDAYADCLAGFLRALRIERAHLVGLSVRRGSGARSVPPAPRARVFADPRERVRRLARLARHAKRQIRGWHGRWRHRGSRPTSSSRRWHRRCSRHRPTSNSWLRSSTACVRSDPSGFRAMALAELRGPAPCVGRGRRTDAPALRRPRCTCSDLDWRVNASRSAKVRTCRTHRTRPRQHSGGPGRGHPRTAPVLALG